MRILVACEESQAVTIELRRLGHEAYSCDIIECSGGHPEWHIRWDALALINGNCSFMTCDGEIHRIDGRWDMLIAHPPCTYLTNAGARHLWKGHKLNRERYEKGLEAKEFFMAFLNADCPKIAVENPIPSKVFELPPYTQTVQPYEYGHPFTKKTCFWLKGLEPLKPTDIVEPKRTWCPSGSYSGKHGDKHRGMFTKDRAKNRSKTFPGIARAMAEQWAGDNRDLGVWIESPACENVCSECGLSADTVKAISKCPNCGKDMRTDYIYPSVEIYEDETGKNPWRLMP